MFFSATGARFAFMVLLLLNFFAVAAAANAADFRLSDESPEEVVLRRCNARWSLCFPTGEEESATSELFGVEGSVGLLTSQLSGVFSSSPPDVAAFESLPFCGEPEPLEEVEPIFLTAPSLVTPVLSPTNAPKR